MVVLLKRLTERGSQGLFEQGCYRFIRARKLEQAPDALKSQDPAARITHKTIKILTAYFLIRWCSR